MLFLRVRQVKQTESGYGLWREPTANKTKESIESDKPESSAMSAVILESASALDPLLKIVPASIINPASILSALFSGRASSMLLFFSAPPSSSSPSFDPPAPSTFFSSELLACSQGLKL